MCSDVIKMNRSTYMYLVLVSRSTYCVKIGTSGYLQNLLQEMNTSDMLNKTLQSDVTDVWSKSRMLSEHFDKCGYIHQYMINNVSINIQVSDSVFSSDRRQSILTNLSKFRVLKWKWHIIFFLKFENTCMYFSLESIDHTFV